MATVLTRPRVSVNHFRSWLHQSIHTTSLSPFICVSSTTTWYKPSQVPLKPRPRTLKSSKCVGVKFEIHVKASHANSYNHGSPLHMLPLKLPWENPNLTSGVIYIDINAKSPKQNICCPWMNIPHYHSNCNTGLPKYAN